MMIRVWLMVVTLLMPALGHAQPPKILVMGDSLSAAYGLQVQQSWVSLLQKRLQSEGYPHRVANASISGETTAGGLARLPAALKQHQPQIVLIELGGNDALRGLKLPRMQDNLNAMLKLSRDSKAQPLLFEMRVPENYGLEYTQDFRGSFSKIAKATRTPLVPFFLASIALDPEKWFLDDGIHPNAAAQPLLLDAVWPPLKKILGPTPH